MLVSTHVPKQKLLIYQTGRFFMVQTLPLLANTCLGSVGHSYTQEDEAQPEERRRWFPSLKSASGPLKNPMCGLPTPFWTVRFNNSPSIEILEFILCSYKTASSIWAKNLYLSHLLIKNSISQKSQAKSPDTFLPEPSKAQLPVSSFNPRGQKVKIPSESTACVKS